MCLLDPHFSEGYVPTRHWESCSNADWDCVSLGWGLGACISNRLPGEAGAVGSHRTSKGLSARRAVPRWALVLGGRGQRAAQAGPVKLPLPCHLPPLLGLPAPCFFCHHLHLLWAQPRCPFTEGRSRAAATPEAPGWGSGHPGLGSSSDAIAGPELCAFTSAMGTSDYLSE